ncbi:hypothetical protein ATANTOWER_017023 [Ataeniobius toweri]|uniref:Immunoglobulin domain-containing protein n=1 Tax=Ataeniobius toweri TaxID=208326 RepID=A0ABU7AGI5_9TELE|nr:hypothetical protein [Ataeniobius toweri]
MKLNLLMNLLWMVLLMVLVHSEAQNVMELKAELGQDVTLTCSFSHPEIFWYMQINNRPRLGIGRTYASAFPTFSSPGFGSRYSLVDNRLLIRNFSVEDGGLYFCGKKIRGAMIYGEPIRVVPDVLKSQLTSDHHHEDLTTSLSDIGSDQDVPDCEAEKMSLITYRSAVILSVLLCLTTALLSTCWKKNRLQVDEAAALRKLYNLQVNLMLLLCQVLLLLL